MLLGVICGEGFEIVYWQEEDISIVISLRRGARNGSTKKCFKHAFIASLVWDSINCKDFFAIDNFFRNHER